MPWWKKLYMHGAIVLALALLAAPVVYYFQHNPLEAVVSEQMAALRQGEVVIAYSDTAAEFKEATSLNEFRRFIEHYNIFTQYNGFKFLSSSRDDDNGTGVIDVELTSAHHESLIVSYLLIKEQKQWRILGMKIAIDEQPTEKNIEEVDLASHFTTKQAFNNQQSRYSLQYPSDWVYETPSKGMVIFSGKEGSRSYFATVSIQTVLAKKEGGDFANVKAFMTDIKKQAHELSKEAKLIDSGSFRMKEKNGRENVGGYMVFTYQYKGEVFKQWQVVILRSDKSVFYAWAYTAPESLYNRYLKTAKDILDSWLIY